MPAWHSLPAAPARHRSPAEPAPRSGFFPEKKSSPPVGGLQHAFFLPMAARPQDCLLQLKDCLLQSCCHPRIASFNPVVTPGLRGTPRGTPRGQLRKNGTCLFPVPNSTRNSTRGNSEKKGHACFQFRTPRGQPPKNGWCLFPVRGTSKAQVPLVLSSITFLPGIGGFDT